MHREFLNLLHTPRHSPHFLWYIHSWWRHPSLRHSRHPTPRHSGIHIHSTHLSRRSTHRRCSWVIIVKLARYSIKRCSRETLTHVHTRRTRESTRRKIHLRTRCGWAVWMSWNALYHLWVHAWGHVVEFGTRIATSHGGSHAGMHICAWW